VLWVELAPSRDAVDIQQRALEKGIAVAPGSIFSARRRFNNCLRISTGQPWSPRIERAIGTLGALSAPAG
jgi:DNA-binding transcriptional MocR family regulator